MFFTFCKDFFYFFLNIPWMGNNLPGTFIPSFTISHHLLPYLHLPAENRPFFSAGTAFFLALFCAII